MKSATQELLETSPIPFLRSTCQDKLNGCDAPPRPVETPPTSLTSGVLCSLLYVAILPVEVQTSLPSTVRMSKRSNIGTHGLGHSTASVDRSISGLHNHKQLKTGHTKNTMPENNVQHHTQQDINSRTGLYQTSSAARD